MNPGKCPKCKRAQDHRNDAKFCGICGSELVFKGRDQKIVLTANMYGFEDGEEKGIYPDLDLTDDQWACLSDFGRCNFEILVEIDAGGTEARIVG